MRFITASALLCAVAVEASQHNHGHSHAHLHGKKDVVEKRGGSCAFPTDAGLVAVTPGSKNAGWAMSPDQSCEPGNYCPYACPSGQVSMQWDPDATSYSYPMSMNGGLYCNEDGEIEKPFPSKPYCKDGTGAVEAVNRCGDVVSICQTVLPGNEAMLIPTLVESVATLAVPDMSYWCETAAHFYINPPGKSPETACVWGTSANPWGNWAAYVAGANTDGDGNTFVKIGWNPIYLELTTPFRNKRPDFGVEIECEGGNCNGLPCKIDPAEHDVNEVTGSSTDGAGGANFCVVTVPKGEKAKIVVFEGGSDSGGGDDEEEETSSSAAPSSTSTSTSTSSSTTTTTTSSTTSTPKPTSTTTTTSSTTTESSTSAPSSTESITPSSSTHKIPSGSSSSGWPDYTYKPHVLAETGDGSAFAASSTSEAEEEDSPSPTSGAQQTSQNAMMALFVVVAMAAFTF
ncbi:SUN domain-containing protein [Aspergillus undulatus]|uniref:SUN domain-containing protein n=1 Tax=Aspergillus undulatus TaxID=1810928 RepID=UPI003CCDEDA2